MAQQTIKTRVRQKHETSTNWAAATGFKPLAGELIVYDADSTQGPRLKIGDETTAVTDLPFVEAVPTGVFGVCDTAADVATKTVTIDGFKLKTGAMIAVKFTNANSIAGPTLNVNGTGDIPICRYVGAQTSTGTTTSGWRAGAIQIFIYDGESWIRDFWENTTYSNAGLGQGYCTCTTAAATTAKNAKLSNYSLTAGGVVSVAFDKDVPANATLNINSKGAKDIYFRGTNITAGIIKAGDIATFIYSTQYHLISVDRWQNDITTHVGDTTSHITSTERTNWNAAKTHADSTHAPSNAEKNQNAFSNVKVDSTTIAADTTTDTLTLVAGSNVTITPNAANDEITIAATDTTYSAAGSSLGLVKSGGDVSISSGVITVNDDSHNHTIANIDDLQDKLDAKASVGKWTCPTKVNAYSGVCKLSGYGTGLLTLIFDQNSQAVVNTYLIGISYQYATITQIGAGGFPNYYDQTVRILQGSNAMEFIVEVLNTFGYNGATTVNARCEYHPLIGHTCTPYTVYTAASSSTVITSVVSKTDGIVASKLYGNASTASKLQTARNINGVSFDGTGDVTVYSPHETYQFNQTLKTKQWYRLAKISDAHGFCCRLQIRSTYNYDTPMSVTLEINATYNNLQTVTQISGGGNVAIMPKIRLVRKPESDWYIEAYYAGDTRGNPFTFAFSSITPVGTLTNMFEAGSIPSGYSATEFELLPSAGRVAVAGSGAISVTLVNDTEYRYTGVTSLSITYPSGNFESWIRFTVGTSANATVDFPSGTTYIGGYPSAYEKGKTYEISIKDKVAIIKKVD